MNERNIGKFLVAIAIIIFSKYLHDKSFIENLICIVSFNPHCNIMRTVLLPAIKFVIIKYCRDSIN